MLWLKESFEKSKKLKDSYSLNGIQIYIKDKLPSNIDMKFVVNYISSRVPMRLMKGVDVIYVGQFENLVKKDVNAMYEDGAIYLTNAQDNDMDIIDDLIHEIAHAAEREYTSYIYNGAIEKEFVGKRKRLYSVLKAEGYEISPTFRIKLEYDKDIDQFLYKEVGYNKLNNLVIGLLPSAYAATSLREYFAICFEEYFMGDIQYLKKISPAVYYTIESLTEMEG
tara:strand:- start:2690 stop:3358 length:669 start_codon:yes stop_codon:yes gene_type:complete